MPPYDPLYRALMGYRRRGSRWAGNSISKLLVGTYRHGVYTPIETGYATQENAHEPPGVAEVPELYEPPHPLNEYDPPDYEPVEPCGESVVGSTPPIRFSTPAEDDVRPSMYDDALMDDWLMARGMSEPDESVGTLAERVDSTNGALVAPHDVELDHLAARMDPLAPEAFRRLRDLPIDDLDEDQLFPAAAMLRLFAPPGAFGPGPGPLF